MKKLVASSCLAFGLLFDRRSPALRIAAPSRSPACNWQSAEVLSNIDKIILPRATIAPREITIR